MVARWVRGTRVAAAAVEEAPADVGSSGSALSLSMEELADIGDKEAMYQHFESLLDTYDFNFKVGDKVVGTVLRVDGKGADIDIGAKGAAALFAGFTSLRCIEAKAPPIATNQCHQPCGCL
jgi:hypothetical protein